MAMSDIKDCFGEQGRDVLFGESCEKCIQCPLFDKCHKVSIAVCLQMISSDTDLITQNGLAQGWLYGYKELEELNEVQDENQYNQ